MVLSWWRNGSRGNCQWSHWSRRDFFRLISNGLLIAWRGQSGIRTISKNWSRLARQPGVLNQQCWGVPGLQGPTINDIQAWHLLLFLLTFGFRGGKKRLRKINQTPRRGLKRSACPMHVPSRILLGRKKEARSGVEPESRLGNGRNFGNKGTLGLEVQNRRPEKNGTRANRTPGSWCPGVPITRLPGLDRPQQHATIALPSWFIEFLVPSSHPSRVLPGWVMM